MRVDFYQLSRDPVEAALPNLARASLKAGERLLVVSADDAQLTRISEALWARLPDSFLAHGRAGGAHDPAQPIRRTDVGQERAQAALGHGCGEEEDRPSRRWPSWNGSPCSCRARSIASRAHASGSAAAASAGGSPAGSEYVLRAVMAAGTRTRSANAPVR